MKRISVKARLVARAFEEQSEIQTDSPTEGKDTIRLFFVIYSSFRWNVESIDVN